MSYTFDYIRAYGSLIGARGKAIQRIVEKADHDEIDLALEPVWFVENDGWKYTKDLHPTIAAEVRTWVAERGGRSDEFILARHIYGAVEVEQHDVGKSTWQERLCMEQGWSDPSNIVWAATFEIHGTDHVTKPHVIRHGIVIQTQDSGVQVYLNTNDGSGWTIAAPVVIAEY